MSQTLRIFGVIALVVTLSPLALAQSARWSSGAPTAIATPATAPPVAQRGDLTFYTDRASFDAANPGLPVENFEDANPPAGSFCNSPSPVTSATNDSCFDAGDVMEGLAIAASGPNEGEPDAIFAAGTNFIGNPSIIVGGNYFSDATVLEFDPGVAAVGVDAYSGVPGQSFTVEVYDTGGTLLGTTSYTSAGLSTGVFVGVSSGSTAIGSIRFDDGTDGDGSLLDDIAFGGGGGGGTVTETVTVTPNVDIPDDGYDGTLASMACSTLDFSGSAITNITAVELSTSIDHTWVGDVAIKVVDPSGQVLAVLNRPDFIGPDDGAGCCGDSANLVSTSPISFFDGASKDAETMGDESTDSNYLICADDPFNCEYFPNPDGAAGLSSFAGFNGQPAAGNWQVCIGDSAGGDPGTLVEASLSITGETDTPPPPTCDQELTATLDDDTPAPGQIITFAVTVDNTSPDPATLDLWLDYTGPVSGSVRLARGTIQGSTSLSRNVRVRIPASYLSGSYDAALNIGDFGAGDVCDTVEFTVEVSGNAPQLVAPNEVKSEVANRPSASARPSRPVPAEKPEVLDDFFAPAAAATTGNGVAVAPNPFARQTTISYEVAAAADVRLAVYDVLGREVAVLVDARQDAGAHRATFDASSLAAGTYVYRLTVGSEVQTGRLTLAH